MRAMQPRLRTTRYDHGRARASEHVTTKDPVHDPGIAAAKARASAAGVERAGPIEVPGGGVIRIGTAGWTEPKLVAAGVFYPTGAASPEERLRYYATRFSMVEVDMSYYAIPA